MTPSKARAHAARDEAQRALCVRPRDRGAPRGCSAHRRPPHQQGRGGNPLEAGEGYINGDGVEKPLGYMKAAALVTVAAEGGQAADTIVRQNVGKMFARVINPSKAVWLANQDTLPALMDLKSDLGQPIWFPNFQAAPGGTLLGRPVTSTNTPRRSATRATSCSSTRWATKPSASRRRPVRGLDPPLLRL
jgi:hypothetical protein